MWTLWGYMLGFLGFCLFIFSSVQLNDWQTVQGRWSFLTSIVPCFQQLQKNKKMADRSHYRSGWPVGCHWQICWVLTKERSSGTGAWQQPLTFPECPDVYGIPLLIHIILPSQHQCPMWHEGHSAKWNLQVTPCLWFCCAPFSMSKNLLLRCASISACSWSCGFLQIPFAVAFGVREGLNISLVQYVDNSVSPCCHC